MIAVHLEVGAFPFIFFIEIQNVKAIWPIHYFPYSHITNSNNIVFFNCIQLDWLGT